FLESNYLRSTICLLEHEVIRNLLKSNGIHLLIALHPFMMRFEEHFFPLADQDSGIDFLVLNHASIERSIEENDMLLT
ncbi:CDP-glycerol--glycerophosphate glycerophosphotransferase, partial [Planococcus sp. SIMBA_143]